MARYADIDVLLEHLTTSDEGGFRTAITQWLEMNQVEDVAPVTHAHWIEKVGMQPTGQHGEHYCSACCGCALRGRPGSGRDIQTKFCPHCGAKMDEVTK